MGTFVKDYFRSLKNRVFYGWWIVILGSIIQAVGGGAFYWLSHRPMGSSRPYHCRGGFGRRGNDPPLHSSKLFFFFHHLYLHCIPGIQCWRLPSSLHSRECLVYSEARPEPLHYHCRRKYWRGCHDAPRVL